ncbi:MAG: isoamylase early set domain-containing protein [Thermaceae bacterium]|nr:isoamylase early set domain-containing protein [Thermaceae bacterium]
MVEISEKNGRKQVIFTLPEGIQASEASVLGDFNDWSPQQHPMRQENGRWRVAVALEPGEYQFRYLVNGTEWYNDEQCECCANPYGGENSLLQV